MGARGSKQSSNEATTGASKQSIGGATSVTTNPSSPAASSIITPAESDRCPMRKGGANKAAAPSNDANSYDGATNTVAPVDNGSNEGKVSRCPVKGDVLVKWLGMGTPPGHPPIPAVPAEEQQQEASDGTTTTNCSSGSKSGSSGQSKSACPVSEETRSKYVNPSAYNVYGQKVKVNPSNHMPENPNQKPSPGQSKPLSVDRVESTIPKGGTKDSTWTYPSSQMFWNALTRKGKVEGTVEDDMDVVVAIHNNMNERTWKEVLLWEKLHLKDPAAALNEDVRGGGGGGGGDEDGRQPKLLKFLGRPHDLSPKARLRMLLGYPMPFDRHDWVVDRGGREVRYVIDYYHDEVVSKDDEVPELDSEGKVRSIQMDVRPALDSPQAVLDRLLVMPLMRRIGRNPFTPLPLLPSESMKQTAAASPPPSSSSMSSSFSLSSVIPAPALTVIQDAISEAKVALGIGDPSQAPMTIEQVTLLNEQIKGRCKTQMQRLADCSDEEDCRRAAMGLTICMGSIACRKETKAFQMLLTSIGGQSQQSGGGGGVTDSNDVMINSTDVTTASDDDEKKMDQAFNAIQQCIDEVQDRAAAAAATAAASSSSKSSSSPWPSSSSRS